MDRRALVLSGAAAILTASVPATPSATPSATPEYVMRITLTFDEGTWDVELFDTPMSRALRERLPMTLAFRDYGGQEKVADLDEPLPMDGMPEGDDPAQWEIGYWEPDARIVLYYTDIGYWRGIARLGRFTSPPTALPTLPDGTEITLAPEG